MEHIKKMQLIKQQTATYKFKYSSSYRLWNIIAGIRSFNMYFQKGPSSAATGPWRQKLSGIIYTRWDSQGPWLHSWGCAMAHSGGVGSKVQSTFWGQILYWWDQGFFPDVKLFQPAGEFVPCDSSSKTSAEGPTSVCGHSSLIHSNFQHLTDFRSAPSLLLFNPIYCLYVKETTFK